MADPTNLPEAPRTARGFWRTFFWWWALFGVVGSGLNQGIGVFGALYWAVLLPWAFVLFWPDRKDRVRAICLACACVFGVLGFFWDKERSGLWFPCIGESFLTPDKAVLYFNKYARGTAPQYWLGHKSGLDNLRQEDARREDGSRPPELLPKNTLLAVEHARVGHPDMGYSESYVARLPDGRAVSFSAGRTSPFPRGSLPGQCDRGTLVSGTLQAMTWLMAGPFLLAIVLLLALLNP